MKKILFFLVAILLSGCGCILSQIPPQKIYAGAGCSAPIPDYKLKITATDNCEIATYIQTPAAGTLLTATNKTATIVVKATDASGNFRQLSFTVTLLDTIKPKFTIDPSLTAYQMQQIEDIYDFGDQLIERQMAFMDHQIADPVVFPPDSFPGLSKVYQDSSYYKNIMLTWTAKGHAVTGYGYRIHQFISPNDTVIVKPKY
jgi:uncharacterized protein YceK